jgi:hypothetical protein
VKLRACFLPAVLILGLSPLALYGCGDDDPTVPRNADYYPVGNDYSWTYVNLRPDSLGGPDTATVAITKIQPQQDGSALITKCWHQEGLCPFEEVLSSSELVRDLGIADPLVALRFPLEVGSAWAMSSSGDSARVARKLDLDLGTGLSFRDVYQVDYGFSWDDLFRWRESVFYAPDVGVVMSGRGGYYEEQEEFTVTSEILAWSFPSAPSSGD